jgi:RNA polymerase sigma-70 factor, ECF subfamily
MGDDPRDDLDENADDGVTDGEPARSAGEGAAPTQAAREWRFTQLWMTAQPTVHSYVRAILGDRAAVDDVMQEVAIAVYEAFDRYDPSRPFVAWALGISRNKARDRLRSLARQHHVVRDLEAMEAISAVAEELDEEMDKRREALAGCLDNVKGRSDDLLRLHYHEGHEPRHIAEQLGLQAGHVRVLLNRVRAALKQCVERSVSRSAGAEMDDSEPQPPSGRFTLPPRDS